MKEYKLILRHHGMFSNVNEVVQQLYLADRDGYRFVIDWSRSPYRDVEHCGDPWEYYFEPCFRAFSSEDQELPVLASGAAVACAKDNIITPRLADGQQDPLLLPADRNLGHKIVSKYIKRKSVVKGIVECFCKDSFNQYTIGVHIRGAGRTDGGVSKLREGHQLVNGVPLELYCSAIDRELQYHPDACVFICSDANWVIVEIERRYPGKVLYYGATRSDFGEMHACHPENEGIEFPKHKLGLDVTIEAYLLSMTDYFVHGNSNVANFVLCENPHLKCSYVYENSLSVFFRK